MIVSMVVASWSCHDGRFALLKPDRPIAAADCETNGAQHVLSPPGMHVLAQLHGRSVRRAVGTGQLRVNGRGHCQKEALGDWSHTRIAGQEMFGGSMDIGPRSDQSTCGHFQGMQGKIVGISKGPDRYHKFRRNPGPDRL